MSALRVLFLTTGYPCDADLLSGTFHRTAVVALSEQGVEVEVVAPVPWAPVTAKWLPKRYQTYYKIPKVYQDGDSVLVKRPRYLQVPGMSDWINVHGQFVHAVLRSASRVPDIIHAHYSYPCGLASVFLSRKWKVPTVLTLHGSDVNVYPRLGAVQCRRFKEAIKGQNKVIAVSRALADATRDITGIRPLVLPVGKNLAAFQSLPEMKNARKSLGLPLDVFVLLFVGNLIPQKGVNELLMALERFYGENVLGVFCGVGPLEQKVRASSNVRYYGLVHPDKIPHFLGAANVLVLPSYREGMPTVLVEAGAAGTPIIASSVGGIPELLNNDRGILIPPQSVDDIVYAVQHVRNNPCEAVERAKRLACHVNREYNVKSSASALIDIYGSCIAFDEY